MPMMLGSSNVTKQQYSWRYIFSKNNTLMAVKLSIALGFTYT